MARGMLSKAVQERAKTLMGREITVTELRLMPYLQYTMVNEQYIDNRKINGEDRAILIKWQEEGYVEHRMMGIEITKKFWDIINELIYIAYVERRD